MVILFYCLKYGFVKFCSEVVNLIVFVVCPFWTEFVQWFGWLSFLLIDNVASLAPKVADFAREREHRNCV